MSLSYSQQQKKQKRIVRLDRPLGNGESMRTLESSDKPLGLKQTKITKTKLIQYFSGSTAISSKPELNDVHAE